MAKAKSSTREDRKFAATKFEPWDKAKWNPPTNAEWTALANPHLVTMRLAFLTMTKTKDELVEMLEKDDEETNLFGRLCDDINSTSAMFKAWAEMMEGAVARLCCAAAALEIRENRPAA